MPTTADRVSGQRNRESALKADSGSKIEPESAVCRSDALATELYPLPLPPPLSPLLFTSPGQIFGNSGISAEMGSNCSVHFILSPEVLWGRGVGWGGRWDNAC